MTQYTWHRKNYVENEYPTLVIPRFETSYIKKVPPGVKQKKIEEKNHRGTWFFLQCGEINRNAPSPHPPSLIYIRTMYVQMSLHWVVMMWVYFLLIIPPFPTLHIYTALCRIKMCEVVETLAPLVYAPATKYTVCPGSSDPFYIVTYYINWVTTSWTYSSYFLNIQYIQNHYQSYTCFIQCPRSLRPIYI